MNSEINCKLKLEVTQYSLFITGMQQAVSIPSLYVSVQFVQPDVHNDPSLPRQLEILNRCSAFNECRGPAEHLAEIAF